MGGKRRRGSDSRCCQPDPGPYVWRHYEDAQQPEMVALDAWMKTLMPFARAIEEGENEELLEAAARGNLWDSGDETTPIKPIRRNPEVFELRRTSLSKKLRFYHGEPPELPLMLIALHRHIKINDSTQQAQIVFAANRYTAGRASFWVA